MREMKDSGTLAFGTIPSTWKITKFKNLFCLRSTKNTGNRELLSVYLDKGVISYSDSDGMQVHKPSESLAAYQNVEIGDFVLNNQQAWRGSVGVSKYRGIISPAYFVYSMTDECYAPYMNYLLRDSSMVHQYELASRGVGTIQRNLFAPWLKNRIVLIPPIYEQKEIAIFLDSQCSEIDAISADIQKEIETLEQYKRSVITEAVTKGLNPEAEMKDSGIGYIGIIPNHWVVEKIKYHLKYRGNRNPGGVQVLSVYREYGVIPKDSRDDNHNVTSEDTSNYRYVRVGDFVINKMKAWQGSMAISDYEGIVSPAYYVYEFSDEHFDRKYFHYLLRNKMYATEFLRVSGGIRVGQWDLSAYDFENTMVPMPPIKEQKKIAAFLDTKSTEIDSLIGEKKRQLEVLDSYKKSLIYEYVTGKKEVPTYES